MPREYFHIEPATKDGLDSRKRSTQRLWSSLDSVVEHEGGFRMRPGFTQILDENGEGGIGSAVILGMPQLLYDFEHQSRPTTEIIRPDADGQYSDAGAGTSTWLEADDSAATYASIDEASTDEATTFVYSPYADPAGSKYSFTFANQAATFATIQKLTFSIRARKVEGVATEVIRPTGDGNYSVLNVSTHWADYIPATDGTHYDHVDDAVADEDASVIRWQGAVALDLPYVSFTMGNLAVDYNTISKITVTVRARNTLSSGFRWPGLEVHHRSGGVDYSIGSATVTSDSYTDYEFESTLNPETDAAWTETELNALEIVLEKKIGPVTYDTYVTQVYVTVEGTIGSTNLELFSRRTTDDSLGDAIEIDSTDWTTYTLESTEDPKTDAAWTDANVQTLELILERDAANVSARPEVTQVYVTIEGIVGANRIRSKLHTSELGIKRMEEDYASYTDIDGAVTTPTCGIFDRWDAAEFATYVYITNGKDDLYFYPDAGDVMGELAGKPVGRTLAAYGGMFHQGDVTDSGTRVKERIWWSDTGDATTWAGGTSGSLDLDETPGAVVKLKNLVERAGASYIGVLVAYKETGIYHLEATGSAGDEFDKRLINGSVGCYAMNSVQGYTNREGREVHAFLGHSGGVLNVFEWNGDTATPIGDPIRDMLDAEINHDQKANAFATVAPEVNCYVLFVATGDRSWPEVAYVYDITAGIWTRWLTPQVTTAGQWVINEAQKSVVGYPDSIAFTFVDTKNDVGLGGEFPSTGVKFETGDLLIGKPEEVITVQRVWVWYREHDTGTACVLDVAVSSDGGLTWPISNSITLDNDEEDIERVEIVGINLSARRPRIRLTTDSWSCRPDITGLTVEFERGGVT